MAARHRSRKRALQVLFEWDMRGEPIDGAIAHYYDTLHSEEAQTDVQLKPDKFMEELARQFSGDESLSFINGVLDAVHLQAG